MIDKLVIGPWQGAAHETESLHEAHPRELHAWLMRTYDSPQTWTVCTYSPTIIKMIWESWPNATRIDRVMFRREDGVEISLRSIVHGMSGHDDLAGAYMRGVFNSALHIP